MIIKGEAGTGKTTLALQLIEELSAEQPEYYLSMRVSDEALFRQFPWLREKARRNEILKAGKAFLRRSVPAEKDNLDPKAKQDLKVTKNLLQALTDTEQSPVVVRTELMKLEGQIEAGEIGPDGDEEMDILSGDGSFTLEIGTMMPELELAYDIVENHLPSRSLIVLDSIEALSETYGIPAQRIVNTIQRDLVEHSASNVTYVLETSGKSILDYLGDGIISMQSEERSGRRVRTLVIEKLRGASVHRWKYLFTLQDGRMSVFDRDNFDNMFWPDKHVPIPEDDPKRISLGMESMDMVLGGPAKGGLVLIEVGEDVPQDFVRLFETTFVLDNLIKKRGLIWYPQHALDYSLLEKQVRDMAKVDRPSELMCVLDPGNQSPEASFVRIVEGADASHDLRFDQFRYQLSSAKAPFVSVLGFNAIEDSYGKDVMPSVMPFIDAMRRGGNVVMAEATSISSSLPYLAHQAKMHIKFESINGTVLVCGQKPFTPYYHFELCKDNNCRPTLMPML
ncbi:MAG: GvpD gas vesicle protein [Methanomassiliicoccales archaeon PtaU1.Bin124]|nr:MAG: GvpD gas vesicle protein [Methanomassiliicoccales archaeon PtaU1.Bin124]